MLIDPNDLINNPDRLEEIEKTSLRIITQAIYEYRDTAVEIFHEEGDLVADIGEDITREALDRLGMPKIDQRLFGKIDYKRACYLFHPEYAVKQALFVDSKAEKASTTATLQTSQFSMVVRQIRSKQEVNEPGKLPTVLILKGDRYITTTVFVKYNYYDVPAGRELRSITIAAVPNGMLQEKYNPDTNNTIWIVGRNSPKRGEEFRVRLSFPRLKELAKWRVQVVPISPNVFIWDQ